MIAVIFEVLPRPGELQRYLEIAGKLRLELQAIDGFVSVERFKSLTTPGKILSLSFWRDEEAVAEWRDRETHRAAQRTGRHTAFADYRLRIGHIVRDYGMNERAEAPADGRASHPEGR
jgi:heme-degrading monooxygenase HmoA